MVTCRVRILAGVLLALLSLFLPRDLHLIDHPQGGVRRHRPLPVHDLIDFLTIGKVFRKIFRAHAGRAKGLQTRIQCTIVDFIRMQLPVDPLVNADCHHALHVAWTRTESQTIQGMQSSSLLADARCRFFFIPLPR